MLCRAKLMLISHVKCNKMIIKTEFSCCIAGTTGGRARHHLNHYHSRWAYKLQMQMWLHVGYLIIMLSACWLLIILITTNVFGDVVPRDFLMNDEINDNVLQIAFLRMSCRLCAHYLTYLVINIFSGIHLTRKSSITLVHLMSSLEHYKAYNSSVSQHRFI